ncbi:ABC transporter substrate-binding protein [Rhodoligotrophos defluvii]|uniref:ABC transporter substrate-binding protein n=1 Tax=Rhodoligotrophos defluvii TaxID=2561934 RepID=UPI001EF0905F|nr:ABC transporter substrate-binding protein [Rhodoligotrophos defluvii]
MALAVAAPTPASAQDDRPMVIARNMDLNSLDPHRAFCDTCQIYNSSVYETLVTLNAENQLVPLLAESWKANGDQTEFTFTLAADAKFSDGSPVEAKDVKWSWERLKNLKGSASFLMGNVASIETPDARTVVVKMTAPNSEFVNIASAPYTAIVNSDVAEANGAKAGPDADRKDNAEAWFLQNSAGSAPFVLERYDPNAELRLKRNDAYWRTPPAVSAIVFRQVKDAVAQAQMLESGSADIAMQIDPDTAKTLQNPDVTVKTVPSYNFIYLALSPGAKANKVPLTKEVREAFEYALDRKGIIEFTIGDEGQVITAPIPIGFPGGGGYPEPEYNPEKAKELLAKAGHPDGITLEATFPNLNAYGIDLSLLMQKVQQDMAKVGIKIELQPVQFSTWRERVNGDGIPLTAVFYAPDYFGTAQYVEYFGMTEGSPWARRAGLKDPGDFNPREAELYKKALASSGDEAAKIWHEIGLEMIKDRIIFPIVSPNLILAYRNDVKGVRYSACCNLPLAELSR